MVVRRRPPADQRESQPNRVCKPWATHEGNAPGPTVTWVDDGSPACGGDDCSGVVHRESTAEGVDDGADLRAELGELICRETGETALRGYRVKPLVTGVFLLPADPPLLWFAKIHRSADRRGGCGQNSAVPV